MRILVLSDLHFGHKRIPGEHIYNNLKSIVYPKLSTIDLVVFTGDTFHSLLDFNNDTSKYVILFLHELFYMSHQYHFGIRFLRGTFTHDRNQVQYIKQNAIRYFGNIKVDLKTYSDISLDTETIKKETIRCLYLPDDLPYNSQEDVLETVQHMLDAKKWEYVDIIFGHGYMAHVLAPGVRGPKVLYTLEALSRICTHLVVFGHVHTPSIKKYKKITGIYVGSFERMCHGEEEPKGYLIIDTHDWKSTVYHNDHTLLFLTYRPVEDTTEKIVEGYKRWLDSRHLSTDTVNYIRVIHSDPSIRSLLGTILKNEYTQYRCVYSSETSRTSKVEPIESRPVTGEESALIIPTEDNIVDLIASTISDKKLPTLSKERITALWNLQFGDTYE